MRLLIVGYYGFANAGDELLLKKTISLLKSVNPNNMLCVLYRCPHDVKRLELPFAYSLAAAPFKTSTLLREITFCRRGSFWECWRAFFKSDGVVFGGGSLFQDHTSWRSLVYYLVWGWLARVFRKQVMLLGQGVGPVNSRLLRKWVVALFHSASAVSFRDVASSQLLGDPAVVGVGSDLAYYQTVLPKWPCYEGRPAVSVGVSLRSEACQSADLVRAFSSFFKKKSCSVVGLSCQEPGDREALLRLQIPEFEDTENIVDMMPYLVTQRVFPYSLDMVVAMRYHACVWASLNGIPFIAVGVDPKLRGLAQDLGQEVVHAADDDFLVKFERVLEDVFKNPQSYQKSLESKVPELMQRSRRHEAVVVSALR